LKKKIAYLTIDDAPSNNFDLILKYLSENKIPAIFFCEGRKIVKKPENIIKAIKAGFSNLKNASEYTNLYHAAVCRSQADWIIGLNITRALTCKYDTQLNRIVRYK
jgi:peptidoglycan/xylan/chitin deacetylase (PgdA/CDA1 family)